MWTANLIIYLEILILVRLLSFRQKDTTSIRTLPITIPSSDEQRRIVARIEELTKRMEEARGIVREIEEELNIFTPSILSKAFRGEL